MRKRIQSWLLLLAGAIMLSGCHSSSSSMPVPVQLSFTRYQPIFLNVAMIERVDDYQSPMRLPNVEHLMPFSPMDAMHTWTNDRLRAVGIDKTLQVIIKDASVTVEQLPMPGGVDSLITISPDKRYTAKLDVEFRIYGDQPMSLASFEATATRTVTMNENASINEREAVFHRMIRDMMEGMNAELEKNIYMYFGDYISYSHNP